MHQRRQRTDGKPQSAPPEGVKQPVKVQGINRACRISPFNKQQNDPDYWLESEQILKAATVRLRELKPLIEFLAHLLFLIIILHPLLLLYLF